MCDLLLERGSPVFSEVKLLSFAYQTFFEVQDLMLKCFELDTDRKRFP